MVMVFTYSRTKDAIKDILKMVCSMAEESFLLQMVKNVLVNGSKAKE